MAPSPLLAGSPLALINEQKDNSTFLMLYCTVSEISKVISRILFDITMFSAVSDF